MKNIVILFGLLLALSAQAQYGYTLDTNLTVTNVILINLTNTYSGTNCLDVSRYRSVTLLCAGSGTNAATNNIQFSFLAGYTTTNWEAAPRWLINTAVNGTSGYIASTNIDVSGVGYIKLYQYTNGGTYVSNAWNYGMLKMYPRN